MVFCKGKDIGYRLDGSLGVACNFFSFGLQPEALNLLWISVSKLGCRCFATNGASYLLLSKETVITRSIIDQLVILDRDLKGKLRVYVAREPGADFS